MPAAVRFIDARLMLGPGDWTRGDQPVTVESVLEAMDHFGIHEALVTDGMGEVGPAARANRRVVGRTRAHPRLHPVWTAMPSQTNELPPPDEWVEEMRAEGVAAAWLPYGAFDIPLESWCLGPLLEPLADAHVPVFLCPTDQREGERADATDWRGVVRICRDFPSLPVIVTESRVYKSQRAMFAAMDACPNLHVDVSALWLHRLIELLCQRFGAERLVWGSQLPYRTPGASLMQLAYSEITEDELALIAGGNIQRLASWNKGLALGHPDVCFPKPTDPLHAAARNRLDLSGEDFHDCHGHIGGPNQRHIVWDTAAELVREMDRFGVQTCCLFTWIGQGDLVAANEVAFRAVEQFPGRFVGFTALNPGHGEDEVRRELQRGLERGMRGIKLVSPIHRYPHDGPLIELACEFAHSHDQFILNHSWGPAEHMHMLCRKYPRACFIAGHSDPRYTRFIREVGNLFICTCPVLRWGHTEELVQQYGADRVLFGSDLQDLPIGWGLGPIFYARVPEHDKRLILGENLKRLLGRYGTTA